MKVAHFCFLYVTRVALRLKLHVINRVTFLSSLNCCETNILKPAMNLPPLVFGKKFSQLNYGFLQTKVVQV